ncbi:MAG TPA: hypothetical protein PLP17_00880 [Oligoflexia bacterium]|nr:hypothetical protein [Oligoflexia bacterium]
MNRKNVLRAIIVFAVYFGLALPQSFAVTSVTPGGGNALSGGTLTINNSTPTTTSVVALFAFLEQDKSYACTAGVSFPGLDTGFQPQVSDSNGVIDNNANGVALRGAVTPHVNVVSSSALADDDRIVITPTKSDNYQFSVFNNSQSSDVDFRLECLETTLYGGYNTNANPFNFLELTNTTNAAVSGRVRGFNFDGSPSVETFFGIAANSRFDIDVHTAAGPNKYGVLIVTHNGPYGALQGVLAQYSGPPSALVLQSTLPLQPRQQTF